jgi:hypothetical protein
LVQGKSCRKSLWTMLRVKHDETWLSCMSLATIHWSKMIKATLSEHEWIERSSIHVFFTLEGSCSMFFCVFSRWQVGTAQVQESESVLGNWRSTVRNTVKATSFRFHRGQPFVRY